MSSKRRTDKKNADPAALDGANFVANVRLSTGEDDTLAEVGETCERVPASSLPHLLGRGKIRPVDAPAAPAKE